MAQKPDITLYHLGASRSIRIAWLLEELDLPYDLVSSPRALNGLAPDDFKAKMGTKLGKSPTIRDHGLVVQESAAIAEYLLETYGADSPLLPPPSSPGSRVKVREWMAAAEGTFAMHALPILYVRWRLPEAARSSLPEMEKALSVNVQNDFDWLEEELKAGNGEFLIGDDLTVADILMLFSVQFILARKLGTEGRSWPAVERWVEGLERLDGYQKAVKRTGYKL